MVLADCPAALADAREYALAMIVIFSIVAAFAGSMLTRIWYQIRYGPEIDGVKEWRESMKRTRRAKRTKP